MGVDTKAKLKGRVSVEEISEFVKNRFNARIRVGVTKSSMDIGNLTVYANYTNSPTWDTESGFIDVIFDDAEKNRSIFYCYSNINCHENYDYYKENHPELIEMVCAETTYISLGHNEQAIEIIGAIADRFGGWFCEHDCGGEYEKVDTVNYRKKLNRIDIMTDIETLGKGDNPPVFQIAACAFDIETGDIVEKFNVTADVSKMNNIEGDTLIWWLNTNKDLLLELLTAGKESGNTERDIVAQFCTWVETLKRKYDIEHKKTFLWGNGILFDNRIIQKKCNVYNIPYPIYYRCDRDMRTLLELASIKMGFADDMEYKNTVENVGTLHNAFDDVVYQIAVATKSYNDIIGKKEVNNEEAK